VLLQQFQWAFEGRTFDDDLWVGARGTLALPTEAARQRTADMFRESSLFVITLGLAEVWYQKRSKPDGTETGSKGSGPAPVDATASAPCHEGSDVLWRAVPSNRYDPKRHGFRVTTVAENVANLREIVSLVRAHVPSAAIVFTLSPVFLCSLQTHSHQTALRRHTAPTSDETDA